MTAHIIVFGNEKGGSGKTTAAMHVAVTLARSGKKVAAIDLDSRQRSFHRQLENREAFRMKSGADIPMPEAFVVARSTNKSLDAGAEEETARLAGILADVENRCDFVVIDTPGADTLLSRAGHAAAKIGRAHV